MIFVDEAKIIVQAGDGGQGCESFYRDKHLRYPRPDGGDGGRGGNVVIVADSHVQTLLDCRYKQHYIAQKGGNASSKGKTGKTGQDCTIKVPKGTIVKDLKTGLLIKDLVESGQSVVVCKGGMGGLGNERRKILVSPQKGEQRNLHLELKFIADVGIVGFPNAGKSTFISNISKVKSKIASYHFTTKRPILGIVTGEEFDFIIADLPGLIEGAHKGKGLGDRFLRHAERTKILLHMIDMAGSEGRNPLDDYAKIEYELQEYSDKLSFKHRIIVANKMDLPGSKNFLKMFRKKYKGPVFAISSLKGEGLNELVDEIRKILCLENSQEK